MAESQSRQGDPGNIRRRQPRSRRRNFASVDIGHPLDLRVLSRCKSGDAGALGWRDRLGVHHARSSFGASRTYQALCDRGEKPFGARDRHSNHRRGGIARLPPFVLAGLWAPKGTPKEIIATLNRAVVAALAEPIVRQRLAELGQEIFPQDQQTPEALGAFQKAEIEKWWPIIKAANIRAE